MLHSLPFSFLSFESSDLQPRSVNIIMKVFMLMSGGQNGSSPYICCNLEMRSIMSSSIYIETRFVFVNFFGLPRIVYSFVLNLTNFFWVFFRHPLCYINITYKGREGKLLSNIILLHNLDNTPSQDNISHRGKTKSPKFLGDIKRVSGRCPITQFARYISSGGGVARGIPPLQTTFSQLTFNLHVCRFHFLLDNDSVGSTLLSLLSTLLFIITVTIVYHAIH